MQTPLHPTHDRQERPALPSRPTYDVEPVETAAPEPASRQVRRRLTRGGPLPAVVLGVIVIVLWELLARSGDIAAYLLPPPIDVLHSFAREWGNGFLWHYTRKTLIESVVGLGLGTAVAIPIGILVARSRVLARAIEPYLAASQAVPAIALAPLLVIWLGYGLTPVAILCALLVFFPTTVNTTLGLRTIDPDPVAAARVDGADWRNLLWQIELPLALPSILAGLRTSMTLSITGAVVGEFVLGDRGLGGLLTIARGNFDTPLVFATLLTLVLLAAAMYGIARLLERWLSYLE